MKFMCVRVYMAITMQRNKKIKDDCDLKLKVCPESTFN